jgi:hypothetical protein
MVLALTIACAQAQKSSNSDQILTTRLDLDMDALLRIRSSMEDSRENGALASWKADTTAGASQVIKERQE